ncbi:MAG: ParB N-terminal domain-containing protein [Fusobacteria bacterium]|nr:ParB N-terminal domain-containing protein [Fusobacteriota bacterium]
MKNRIGSILDRSGRKNMLLDNENNEVVTILKKHGRLVNLTKNLIDDIDFNDKTFINRIYNKEDELEISELKESIRQIGLINIVYLFRKDNGKFRIISGLRRLTACKSLYLEGIDVNGQERVILLEESTPDNYLEFISIDENTKRKNLKLIELSYKLNKEAEKDNVEIEEIMERYNISRRHYFRIKGAINFPNEIKNILEEIGLSKAELLLTLIKLEKEMSINEIIDKYSNCTREDLQGIIKEKKKDIKKLKVEYKIKGNNINIKINKKLPNNVKEYLVNIIENIKNDNYSFLDN